MAENDTNDDVEQDVDTSEPDGTDDNGAEQLPADAVDEDDKAAKSATDEKDWAAESKKWRELSRKNEKAYKDAAAKLKQFEDANKSESERLQESLTEHQTRAQKAETALKRREIAEERAPEHATVAQIKAVAKRLSGESDEDLEADADELFELLAPATAAKTVSRPKERLKGGSEPDEDPEPTDPAKLAALIPRRR